MTKRRTDQNRKRRPDAWEIKAGLTQEQLRQAFAWARSMGYAKAISLMVAEWKIKPPTISAFSAFYTEYSRTESEERVHRAIVDSAEIRALAAQTGDVSEAMLAALDAEAAAAILSNDPERIKLLVGLALKAHDQRTEEKKYKDAMKTSVEKGLDALAEEAQGNPEALELFARFKTAVMKSVEAAA